MTSSGLPFKPWRPSRRRTGELNVSPLENRSMSIMEYYDLPKVRLDDIVGLDYAKDQIREWIRAGSKSLLITGPQGSGKSVLALATATELGRHIIDVDFSKLSVKEEKTLDEMIEYIKGKHYTVILYNIDSYMVPNDFGSLERIIIYDPYIDYNRSMSQRIIIYDPYTDQERLLSKGEKLEKIIRNLKEASSYLVATASMTWILPPSIRNLFDFVIRVRLPGYKERFEILSRLLRSDTGERHDIGLLALLTHGCSVQDLKHIAEMINEGRKIEDIMKDYRCLAERLSARINY